MTVASGAARGSQPRAAGQPGGRLVRNRAQLELDLRSSRFRQYQSPALLALHTALTGRVRSHLRGRVLDVGCGAMPFRRLIESVADEYRTLDVERRVPGVDYVSDAQDMRIIDDGSFDGILCSEVLEHVPKPQWVLRECARVLTPGGRLVLSVPCLSRLHEEPHDYYRFTNHGLCFLLDEAGFDVDEVVPTGSILSFLGHQASTALLCTTWHVPLVRGAVFWLNALAVSLPAFVGDRVLGLATRFPLGFVAVARKRVH